MTAPASGSTATSDGVGRVPRRRAATRARILASARALAREHGVGALSLRELARSVGMRAPSLYEYFGSKADIYDALFAEGYEELLATMADLMPEGPVADEEVRPLLHEGARRFLAFCTADGARYQLMFQRPVPGYEPSAEAYRPSVEALERFHAMLAAIGIADATTVDLCTAVLTGLADQQLANDPGGDRWVRLAEDAMDMVLAHARGGHRT